MKNSFVYISLFLFLFSYNGYSQTRSLGYYLKCTKSQKSCYVDSSRLTIGDKVGFFTATGELVATGSVDSAKKDKKEIKVDKKFSRIRHSHRIRVLTDAQYELLDYPRFRENKKMKFGFGLGVGEFSTTGTMQSFLLGLHFDYAQGIHGFAWTGRLNTYYGSRDKSFNPTSASDLCVDCPLEHSIISFSLLVGASYQTPRNYPVSLRIEGNVGGAYSISTIGGDPSQDVSESFESEVDNGFNFDFGMRISALYNMADWQPEVALQANRLDNTLGWFATVGAVYAIK